MVNDLPMRLPATLVITAVRLQIADAPASSDGAFEDAGCAAGGSGSDCAAAEASAEVVRLDVWAWPHASRLAWSGKVRAAAVRPRACTGTGTGVRDTPMRHYSMQERGMM